jgi:hypothetical protein
MTKMRQVFEALMRSKGHTDFSRTRTDRYVVVAMQVRWSYFQLGWEMRGVNK